MEVRCPSGVAWHVLWIAAVVLGSAGPARADHGFVWAAPTSCPDEANVRERIERRLGEPVDGGALGVHGVEVEIAREGGGYVARIDARGLTLATQVRTLTSARCEELADAVAVVVARLATEARTRAAGGTGAVEAAGAAEGTGGAQGDRGAPGEKAAAQTRSVMPAKVHPSAGPWGGGVRALAVSGVGTLPGVGVGGEVAVYARRRSYYAEVAAARWARNAMYLAAGAPGAVDVGLTTGALRLGWSPPNKYIRAWLGAEVGPMTGVGIAIEDPQVGSGRWSAAGGGFGVTWPMFDRVRLVGSIEILAPLERVRFVLSDGSEIYRSSNGVARCALGLEVGWR